ncbi:sulfatase [Sphingobacterium sp. UT-1RO-CII-1]|uniref:sulfatase family protein n=1 Tax=Sphingobacterium sp. UT-1RO-CII-1 TaxID=2995225 RepID=UPI00227C7E6B|nr:sulfatase [Sphingobacterium sp. UT-1RO-CII-1]MCY4778660.1 sulfatase [Sphingobacterium sp. UT-1RO-CII-1]
MNYLKNLTLILLLSITHSTYGQTSKKNIVIIISDDHAYQTIGAYGSHIAKTPNIDRLAKEGTVFNKAYVTNSICGPSRATLLTGKYSHKNGFKDNETSNFDHSQDLFVKRLRNAGYKTAWIGKQHLGNNPQGFDYSSILIGQGHYFNPDFINTDGTRERVEGYVSDIVTQKATSWLDTLDKTAPFCLIIGHKATHRTWMPDPKDFGKYDDAIISLPETFYDTYEGRQAAKEQEMSIAKDMQMGYDLKMYKNPIELRKDGNFARMTEQQFNKYLAYYKPIHEKLEMANLSDKALAEWKYRRYMIDYLNTAESMDRNIGTVLNYLDENDLTDNTIVIYLSDQGFYMGEHGWFDKRFMYEESFRTPMLARLPGVIKPNTITNAMVMNVDIAPTLLELANVEKPKDMQGVSFLPTLKNNNKKTRKGMFYHYYENGEHAVSPHFGVSDGRYKLIRFYKRVEGWELFDLEADPNELNNVYGKAKYRNIQNRMEKILRKEVQNLQDEDAANILQNIR